MINRINSARASKEQDVSQPPAKATRKPDQPAQAPQTIKSGELSRDQVTPQIEQDGNEK